MTSQPAHRAAFRILAAGCLLLGACSNAAPAASSNAGPAVATVATQAPIGATSAVAVGSTAADSPDRPTPAAAHPTPESTTAAATPTPAAAGGGATTACELVTEQEATVALGADPGPGQATPLGDTASACSYLLGASVLQLSLTPTGGKARYDQEHAGIPSGTAGVTDVTGIGDGAFSQISGTRAAINFDKGDALVVIGLTTAGGTPTQEQLATLATTAASRL